MPKQKLDLRNFKEGLVTNYDRRDTPLEAFLWGTDQVKTNANGRIDGFPSLENQNTTYGIDIEGDGAFFYHTNGRSYYVYKDDSSNQIKILDDFHGSPSDSGYAESASTAYFIKLNRGVAIGRGTSSKALWAGYYSGYDAFGQNAVNSRYLGELAIDYDGDDGGNATEIEWDMTSITTTSYSGNDKFVNGTQYYFAYALEYEGNYTPIRLLSTYIPSSDCYLNIQIRVGDSGDATNVSRRINKVVLFAKDSINGFYRYIDEYDMKSGWTGDGGTPEAFYRNESIYYNPQESYEALTGIPEAFANNVDHFGINFESGCLLNGSLFLYGKNSIINENALYRTEPNFYAMYNGADNFLYFNNDIDDVFAYQGKVYAIGDNRLTRVNYNLFIEDINIGTNTENKVLVTEYGAFWAYDNKAFRLYNNKLEVISRAIEDKLSNIDNKQFGWDGVNSDVYIVGENTAEADTIEDEAFVYNVLTNEWAYRGALTGSSVTGLFTDKYGVLWFGNASGLHSIDNTNSTSTYTVYLGVFDFDNASQDKKFYKIILNTGSTGSITSLSYDLDDANSFTSVTGTNGTYELKSGGEWIQGKNLRLKIVGDAQIRTITIIYRPLIGLHND